MPNQPLSKLVIQDWPGRISAVSPHAVGTGALVQNNLVSTIPGQLKVRKGMRPVTWTNTMDTSTFDILSAHRYRRPAENWVIYLDSNGAVIAGRDPA